MLPILTPAEMRAVDAAAADDVDVLVERAGSAVARAAIRMLGGTYGRTVHVIVGSGNNGNDGRVAARQLRDRGVRVRVFEVASCPDRLPPADLVIDAAFGTGFHGVWQPPDVGDVRVLAVDIPSGVDGHTGTVTGDVLAADRTVSFVALKPGLLFEPGRTLAGELEVVDVGLDPGAPQVHLLQASDVAAWMPPRASTSHKWHAAVRVIAGSRTMPGAAALASAAAQRVGAGMVQWSTPGAESADRMPIEAVHRPLPAAAWASEALRTFDRFHALVIGPGLGRADDTAANTRQVVIDSPLPVVVDGDGLFALAWNAQGAAALLRRREAPTVLTPHDGEYQLLTGAPPGADRIAAARRLAADAAAVVLLKGPTTVVAEPDGEVLVVRAGDERLATAGTGDVLAGVVGALLAMRVDPFEAAAMGAWIHGRAAVLGPPVGLVASDLLELLPTVLAELHGAA
ncbi:MAG: NAD(P)H-hydrate dehydratase [Acidimicrobiales bacterium]|nr:NAD(P)H-hydrate dehydratase [Acidimicrobiales bacterium]MCB9392412.1 NAD(P)H-hydrate dehydratase [Acidimicrobiaceae bacterium]